MSWLLPRIGAVAAAMIAGGLAGSLVGQSVGNPVRGAFAGCAVAVVVIVLADTVRGHRLVHWLRGTQAGEAPRDTGFWGELGYRVERTIRQHEHRAAAERLRLDRFLSAMEASPIGVLLLDRDQQIEWCNSTAADHFGLDPVRDAGQPVTNLVRVPAFVAHLRGGRYEEPVIVPMLRATSPRAVSVLVRRYGDEVLLLLSQDVTERERADAMRRDFVANVSHEIRTPLTVLAGFVETMQSLPLGDAERARILGLMAQQTGRMQALVADLLTLAQLEGSPRPLADQWVPLAPLVVQVVDDARALSAGRHRITADEVGPVRIAGAQAELLSALSNLVSNAVRYTPEGGSIGVHWRTLGDGSGEISVVDSGPGIAREHLPRLAERFYRIDGSRSRDTGGTGLGLAIVKHVAQRHGGELRIASELGKGSTFRIVLPAVRVRIASGAQTA